MRITALRLPPEGAPGKSLAEGVAKVVCQVDGEPVGPAPCKPVELSGPRGRGTDQDKARGFPSGPGASNSAPYRGRIYDRNRHRLHTSEQPCARGWVHIREFESTPLRQRVIANRCLVVAFGAAARFSNHHEKASNAKPTWVATSPSICSAPTPSAYPITCIAISDPANATPSRRLASKGSRATPTPTEIATRRAPRRRPLPRHFSGRQRHGEFPTDPPNSPSRRNEYPKPK
jgi:hypothetical protein